MKYRLLKPIDICVAGDIFEVQDTGNNCSPKRTWLDCRRTLFALPIELATDPDWFEEVKAFQPEVHEQFFFITPAFDVDSAKVQPNDMYDLILNAGNCFRTLTDAEACAVEMRKLLKQWREDHP